MSVGFAGENNMRESERKDEISPVCRGDGGASGGCYKCGGSGSVEVP